MKAVIMAGGKGTRIASLVNNIPKPMIPISDKPVLEYQIQCLAEQGFKDIIITVSHLGNIICDYFGNGEKFGVSIEYYYEEIPLGNAGALFKLKNKLKEDFLLLNADSMFSIDFNRFVEFHKNKGGLVTIFSHPNNHPYDSGLIICDENNCVLNWLTKEDARPKFYQNIVNAGLHIISPKILEQNITEEKIDLDRHLLKPLAGTGKLFSYSSPEYVSDMGTPERYKKVCKDFERGIVKAKNLANKQKAIFLDRDGTINKYVGFLREIDDFELLPGVSEAIKLINESEYLAIVLTNQPVIARGEVSYSQLRYIHDKMETLLGNTGAYINGLYFCPHHPHSGYKGEVVELKIECECRKPKSGMFYLAQKDFNIDLSKSFMIGDSDSDIEAGENAGCKGIKVSEEFSLLDAVMNILEVK